MTYVIRDAPDLCFKVHLIIILHMVELDAGPFMLHKHKQILTAEDDMPLTQILCSTMTKYPSVLMGHLCP